MRISGCVNFADAARSERAAATIIRACNGLSAEVTENAKPLLSNLALRRAQACSRAHLSDPAPVFVGVGAAVGASRAMLYRLFASGWCLSLKS